jgi:hypothetical protein
MSEVREVHFCIKPHHHLETFSIIKLQKHKTEDIWGKSLKTKLLISLIL